MLLISPAFNLYIHSLPGVAMTLKSIYARLDISVRRGILINSVLFFLTGLILSTGLSLWTLPAKAFNFTSDAVRPADTINYEAMGYTYDTLPIQGTNTNLNVRKNAASLTQDEINRFTNAVKVLKSTINSARDGTQISIYDQFVATHLACFDVAGRLDPNGVVFANPGHRGSAFLPWHREFLHQFEQMLQVVDPTVTIPYWDYTDPNATQNIIFQNNFMGPNGTTNFAVQSGFFSSANGWWQRRDLSGKTWTGKSTQLQPLTRRLRAWENLPTQTQQNTTLATTTYNNLESSLERTLHDTIHLWVGGSLGNVATSPNDPMFWLLHGNVDRLWAQWQVNGHWGNAWYPATSRFYGHGLNDLMWPWDQGRMSAVADLQALIPGIFSPQASSKTEFRVASTPEELLLDKTNHLYNPFGSDGHDMDAPQHHEDNTDLAMPTTEKIGSA